MGINSFHCRSCGCSLRLTVNWDVHRAKNRHYICRPCNLAEQTPDLPPGHGYVYLIRAENHPGRYKIGKSRNPWQRCKKFNTSCPDRSFSLVNAWYDSDCHQFELDTHKTLAEYRLQGTEWFEGDGENFSAIITRIHVRRSQALQRFSPSAVVAG